VIGASLFEERLKVVLGRSRLELAATHDLCGVLCAGIACLLVDVIVIINHDLLAMLFAPLLATLGDLLSILDGDIGWRSPAAAQAG
jgi:hypothetical protein